MRIFGKRALACALCATSAIAPAATISFTGARFNIDAPGPAAQRCVDTGRATTNIRNGPPPATSVGTSNLGAFTPTLSHCISLPLSPAAATPFDLGEFLFAFASGDTLFGTYSGMLTPTGPGLFAVSQTHLVTGGTGVLAGATGSFASNGVLTFPSQIPGGQPGPPFVQQNFAGTLEFAVAPVPEPATWAMLIGGFGAIGASLRRRAQPGALAHA